MAVQLAQRPNYRLALLARRKELLDEVASKCGGEGKALVIPCDVTKRDEVKDAVGQIMKAYSRIDVWVNNAGRGLYKVPSELTDEDMEEMMRVNVHSALYGMQEVLPVFKAQKSGHVINVSSLLGRIADSAPFRSAYVGAKHFLNGLTGTFRAELREQFPDIRFTTASPGIIATDFGINANGPDSRTLGNAQDVDECAAEIIRGAIDNMADEVYTVPAHVEAVRQALAKLLPAA